MFINAILSLVTSMILLNTSVIIVLLYKISEHRHVKQESVQESEKEKNAAEMQDELDSNTEYTKNLNMMSDTLKSLNELMVDYEVPESDREERV